MKLAGRMNVHSLRFSLLTLLIPLLLFACGGGGDGDGDGDNNGGGNGNGMTDPGNDPVTIYAKLIGTWAQDCAPFGGGNYFSNIRIYSADGTLTTRLESYSDADCQNPTGAATINEHMYTIGEKFTTPLGVIAVKADGIITRTVVDGVEQPDRNIVLYESFHVDGDRLYAYGDVDEEDRPTEVLLLNPFKRQ